MKASSRLNWITAISLLFLGLIGLSVLYFVLVLSGQVQMAVFWKVSAVFLFVFFLLGFLLGRVQKIAFNRLWTNLRQVLTVLEQFDVDEPKKIQFSSSGIVEFNDLRDNLNELIGRIHLDYRANKQFTQNAAHELQTPLTVIKANAELLLQSPNIKEREMEAIGIILHFVTRLSKVNSALILLSKIEHGRFNDLETVKICDVFDSELDHFYDLIRIKGLKVEKNYSHQLAIRMSVTLAEILIANLLQNAIRHNKPKKGFIRIEVDGLSFAVINSGHPLEGSTEKMFKRFKKESTHEESLGLGLSIIRRICEFNHLHIEYNNSGELHELKVSV